MELQGAHISPSEVIELSLSWLFSHYNTFRFWTERDVVWTIQQDLNLRIDTDQLPYRVFHNYPLVPGSRQSLCVDLAILADPFLLPEKSRGKWGASMEALAVVEFKYEPDHKRYNNDIWPTKETVVGWSEVLKDIERVQNFIAQKRTHVAYAILIDEGNHYRHLPEVPPGKWHSIENSGSVHKMRLP